MGTVFEGGVPDIVKVRYYRPGFFGKPLFRLAQALLRGPSPSCSASSTAWPTPWASPCPPGPTWPERRSSCSGPVTGSSAFLDRPPSCSAHSCVVRYETNAGERPGRPDCPPTRRWTRPPNGRGEGRKTMRDGPQHDD